MTTNFIPVPEVPTETDYSLWTSLYSLRDAVLKVIELFQRTDKGWIAPILLNGWQDFEAGEANPSYGSLAYWKDPSDVVHVRGYVSAGTPGTDPVCVLPAGYRPELRQSFSGYASGGTLARIDIDRNGVVYIIAGHTTYTPMCFSFRAQN